MANPKNRDFGQTALVAGSLRGYRAWGKLAGGSSEVLFSPLYNRLAAPWGRGRNEAQCMQLMSVQTALACCESCSAKAIEMLNRFPADHRSPSSPSEDSEYCGTCGFYAFHAPSRALAKSVYLPLLGESPIVGSIKATGFIVVGELGFRAQYVEIEALCGLGAEPAAEHYGVPWFATMDELVEHFPADKTYDVHDLYASWDDLFTFGILPHQSTVRMDPDTKRIFVFGSDSASPRVELTPGVPVATIVEGTTLVTLTLCNGRIDITSVPWSGI